MFSNIYKDVAVIISAILNSEYWLPPLWYHQPIIILSEDGLGSWSHAQIKKTLSFPA
jgi:hypothetical protein